jgi:hypothetical protein
METKTSLELEQIRDMRTKCDETIKDFIELCNRQRVDDVDGSGNGGKCAAYWAQFAGLEVIPVIAAPSLSTDARQAATDNGMAVVSLNRLVCDVQL